MVSQRKKFERWSGKATEITRYLIQMVQRELVPPIIERGFVWVEDYGLEGKARQVGGSVIPFQIRSGDMWPTLEILFSSTGRPWFSVRFGWVQDGFLLYDGTCLTKQQATLTDAPLHYALAKDKGTVSSLFMQFGYHWWTPFPRKVLASEVAYAKRVLPAALDMLAGPLPTSTNRGEGYIAKNIYRVANPLHRE